MFGVEIAGHQDRQAPAETVGQVRSDQRALRRKVSRRDFHWFAGQYDLDGGSLQVVQSRDGHLVLDYTTADQDGCATPIVSLYVRWQT
jgi:hypothetical protein